MRANLPVTDTEIILSDNFSIVSTTDLNGNITYANPYFVEVSGFSVQELLGAPQNILRHPDMPVEAFADLWATIKTGRPWTGMVKNRAKSGDFYWVLANVTPVYADGLPVGYMSVRTKPSRDQVQLADAVYKEIREGNPRRLLVQVGSIVSKGLLVGLGRIGIGRRIQLSVAVALLAFVLLTMRTLWPDAIPVANALDYSIVSIGILAMIYIAISVQRNVLNPLVKITHAARIMAGGDLTHDILAADQSELGQLQNALRQSNINLRSIIGDVRSNFENIKLATHEIAAGNMDLSNRTESQAASLEETSASMNELSGAVQQSASSAAYADEMAQGASTVVKQSGSVVGETVLTMKEINTASHKIVDIIDLINGIAFQTNILALNAAVEAARAGEQGRGFAVVASEVRSLAGRSATAAKDIKELIDASISKVDVGMKLTTEAGHSMQMAIESVEKVTTVMAEITQATCTQGANIGQISESIKLLDDVTQQNAALVEEAAAAAGNLSEQTTRLTNALAIFKLPNAGTKS
jgi:aerotaxis receptor